MMISTILLLANLAYKIFQDKVFFSFMNFLWIYPAEIAIWLIGFVAFVLITDK